MKKRILSLALSLSLAISLFAPALAAEADENYYTVNVQDLLDWSGPAQAVETKLVSIYEFRQQYLEEHPELREDFDAEAWYLEYYAWDLDDMTKEEYMAWTELSEEEFQDAMWQSYVWTMGASVYDEADAAYTAYVLEYYEATHPGELESLSTDGLLARLGYTETLTPAQQFMQDWELDSEEEIRPTLLRYYVTDRLAVEETHADFLAYQERYPERWAEFDADAYFNEEYGYWYDGGKEEYMNYWTLFTEEEFVEDMFVEYVEDNRWDWDETWNWDWDSYERPITLVINGQAYEGEDFFVEDGVSYLDGATLCELLGTEQAEGPVAIRAAAGAAGWDVVWNENYRQVILLDREKLTHGVIMPSYIRFDDEEETDYIECDFSNLTVALERLMTAGGVTAGKSLRTVQEAEATLTRMDSLDGDQTYSFGLKQEQLSRDGVFNWTITLDLADLADLLGEDILSRMSVGITKPNRQALLEALGEIRGEIIWNLAEETFYLNLPVVALLDKTLDGDTWYGWDLPMPEGTPGLNLDVGEMLYAALLEDCATSDGWYSYFQFMQNMLKLNAYAGANAFTWDGEDLIWSLTEEQMMGLMGIDMEEGTSLFKEYTCSLALGPDGSMDTKAVIRPDMKAIVQNAVSDYYWYDAEEIALLTGIMEMLDFRYQAEGHIKDGNGSTHMEIHWKNQLKLTVDTTTTTQQTNDLPLSAPPEGSIVERH